MNSKGHQRAAVSCMGVPLGAHLHCAAPEGSETRNANPASLRGSLPGGSLVRSTAKGVCLFVLSAAFFVATFSGSLFVANPFLKVACSLANAISIALLFVIGHDACHGSLTSSGRLNQLLGRLAFLPSWHPFTSWDLGHNRLHHCWTNLRGKDYVWTPLSKMEFDQLPGWRRGIERFYRSVPGVGGYYFAEIWLRHLIFPRPEELPRLPRKLFSLDRGLVTIFGSTQCALAAWAGWPSAAEMLMTFACAVLLPQSIWNWLMGFVILLHHTHPSVRWYDDPDEWSFHAGQLRGTVHVIFPWPIGLMLHHIMEHTAHHIDPRVPLYNLPAAQRALERDYVDDVIVSRFTLSNFRFILSRCQLYDYREHKWLKFDGSS